MRVFTYCFLIVAIFSSLLFLSRFFFLSEVLLSSRGLPFFVSLFLFRETNAEGGTANRKTPGRISVFFYNVTSMISSNILCTNGRSIVGSCFEIKAKSDDFNPFGTLRRRVVFLWLKIGRAIWIENWLTAKRYVIRFIVIHFVSLIEQEISPVEACLPLSFIVVSTSSTIYY